MSIIHTHGYMLVEIEILKLSTTTKKSLQVFDGSPPL